MGSRNYKNFRLQGIPDTILDRSDLRQLVREILSLDVGTNVTVHSLASSPIAQSTKVATLSFDPVPSIFSGNVPSQWRFPIPTPGGFDEGVVFRRRNVVFDTHFQGLTPLHHQQDHDCSIDLIAVSGLGGHAFGSFKEREGPFMWLRDALPFDLPNARILIYGYDTQLQGSSSFQSLTDLGRGLQMAIEGMKTDSSAKNRQTLFLGHSLGGLIIKEAVIMMKSTDDDVDRDILSSTSAFLFFGVPHQGMAMKFLVPLVKDQPNRALIESLDTNSSLLWRQQREFPLALGSNEPQVVSFFETKQSPTAEFVDDSWRLSGPLERLVDPASATYGSKSQHPIDRTHSELVKFDGDFDRSYRTFLVVLWQLKQHMARMAPQLATEVPYSKPDLSQRQIDCLQSLAFKEQNLRQDDIILVKNTCDWIFDDLQYASWLRATRGLFWIKGNPGVGKSTVMRHAAETMHKVATKELVASFFIHGRGVPLQKILIGLYRALLSALLGHFPDHISQLTERFEEKERQFGSYERQKWEWNESELQKFLFSFLLKASTSRHVVIYIDALDECGAETAQKLLAYLRQLIASAEQQGSHVRICFSFRHYPILGLENVPTICVEDRNDQDIRRVVRNGLQDIDSSKRHQIENEIVAKAQGGFQWAVLVLDKAVQPKRRGINAQTIHEEISAIPAELNQLYSDLLNISDAHERQQTKKLFQWVLCAQMPLKIEELREALAIDADAAYTSITDLRASKDYCDSVPDAERRIKDLSRGLIEIRERKVLAMVVWDENAIREAQFIHQSVADFLIRNGQTTQDLFASAQTPLGIGHSEISRSCSLYLGLDEILGAAERSWYYFKDEFPFASYAADYMFQHLQIAEQEGFPQLTALNRLQQWTDCDGTFDRTLQLWNTLTEGSKSFVPYSVKNSNIWHFMSFFGVPSAVRMLLQNSTA